MTNNKNMTIFQILLITACVSLAGLVQAQDSQPIEVRFSHVAPDDSPKGKMARYFQELVRERIGPDKMVVTVFPEARIIDDERVMDAVLKGKVEIAAPSLSLVKQYSPRYQLFDLPFIFASPAAAEAFLKSDYANRLVRTLERKGFYGFGYMTGGMSQITSNKKVVVPEDLSGMAMSTTSSQVEQAWVEEMEARPVELAFSRVSRAIRRGKVDGQMNVYSNIYANKFHKHQKYILESNHIHQGYIFIASSKFMQGLPQDIREQVKKLMSEAIAYGNDLAKESNEIDRQNIVNSGESEITKLTVDQRQRWIKQMLPFWKRLENEIGKELIQAAASQR